MWIQKYLGRLSKYKWHIHRHNTGKLYVKGDLGGKIIGIHRLIMNVIGSDLVVDHKDGDPLNNQKSNLRICSQLENTRNKKRPRTNTSGFKGVVKVKNNRWRVVLKVNQVSTHGGYFSSPIDAAKRYNELAIKYFGEFACLNEIPESTTTYNVIY